MKIDKTRIVENGVQADGEVMLKILYIIGNDDMPGILIYMVKPGDELWDIARKYHTSIQEIRTINALKENQEPSPGTPLLVVKKVEGQIK